MSVSCQSRGNMVRAAHYIRESVPQLGVLSPRERPAQLSLRGQSNRIPVILRRAASATWLGWYVKGHQCNSPSAVSTVSTASRIRRRAITAASDVPDTTATPASTAPTIVPPYRTGVPAAASVCISGQRCGSYGTAGTGLGGSVRTGLGGGGGGLAVILRRDVERNMRDCIGFLVSALFTLLIGSSAVHAQSRSGYGAGNSLEGGDSVTGDIHLDDIDAGSAFRIPGKPLKPWFDTKRKWNDSYGLKLNFSVQTLHQWSDNSIGEDYGAGGRFELNGSWTLVGRGTQNSGRLTFRLEDRSTMGTTIPPSKLGNQFGSGTIVGTGFSDYDSANLSELAWRQSVMNGRLKFVFGKISAASWYGGHALSSPKRGFQNTALMASNTRAFPGRGIGAGVGYQITPKLVALAGIHDANAQTTENPFDTIGQKEFLKALEFRWYLTTPERARWDQVRLMFWHQDARKQAGVPSSQGASIVASKLMFNDKALPFLVAGISDGNAAILKKDLAIGVAFGFDTTSAKARDVLGIGLAWGEPSNAALQEQITGEIYYRFQILDNIAITPSLQLVRNPVANPSKTTVAVVGLRLRATF